MNQPPLEGKWAQLSGRIKQHWALLTDDDIMTARGRRDVLCGKLQERYGIAKEEAEKQYDEFMKTTEKVRTAQA